MNRGVLRGIILEANTQLGHKHHIGHKHHNLRAYLAFLPSLLSSRTCMNCVPARIQVLGNVGDRLPKATTSIRYMFLQKVNLPPTLRTAEDGGCATTCIGQQHATGNEASYTPSTTPTKIQKFHHFWRAALAPCRSGRRSSVSQ
jgi:hypothetical protein